MKISAAVLALASAVPCARAQSPVPIVNLPPATAFTAEKFGVVLSVRQISDGRVFVDDAGHHTIRLYDSTLKVFTLVADSTQGEASSYGPLGTPLLHYFGDSSLFTDFNSRVLLVLDAKGQVARTLALPGGASDFIGIVIGPNGTDPRGRIVYPLNPPTPQGGKQSDSTAIVRADLDARSVDTIGKVKQRGGMSQVMDRSEPGKITIRITLDPLPAPDDWAVLSDGTVAFVRGHDYHIDWVHPDGTMTSSPKMPFDWKRLTDDDKQKLIDSARSAQAAAEAARAATATGRGARADGGSGSGGRGAGGGGGVVGAARSGGDAPNPVNPVTVHTETNYVALKDMTDYYPAIRPGAAKPDRDGNLWILPTTSAQSQHGELIYDVVNTKGDLFERVRLPEGRSIVGFGAGGVVYVVSGDRTNGFVLERARLAGGAAKAR
jgi:hypothetical protein